MQLLHVIASASVQKHYALAIAMARFPWVHASALKATHKAGRRGGESIARQHRWQHLILRVYGRRGGAVDVLACGKGARGAAWRVGRLRRSVVMPPGGGFLAGFILIRGCNL
jgi:hypothetical protein